VCDISEEYLLKCQKPLSHQCSVSFEKTIILDYTTVTTTKLKFIITHAFSRVLLVYSHWSVTFIVAYLFSVVLNCH